MTKMSNDETAAGRFGGRLHSFDIRPSSFVIFALGAT
jgi:hypothetical protein